jgi:hypothetical protein
MSEPSYVALKPCGHMVACVVEDPKDFAHSSRLIIKWQKEGFTIKRVEAEEIRNGTYKFCKCGKRAVATEHAPSAPLFGQPETEAAGK